MAKVDESFLIERIRMRKPAVDAIVSESFPITNFGDINSARTVTVGINPSVDEFRSRAKGRPTLREGKKRFVDREVLGLGNDDIPTKAQAKFILEGNNKYFKVKPYHWFNGLQKFALDPFGLSYVDGSAVHLDLVQWATDPVWRGISDKAVREELVRSDREFLRTLLEQKAPELVMLNGAFVCNEFVRQGFFSVERELPVHGADRKLVLLDGTVAGSRAIGWNMNIQAQNTPADRERLQRQLEIHAST